jgi:hypothetical protein
MMKAHICRTAILLVVAALPVAVAHAQLEGMMNKGSGSSNLKDLAGGLGGHSLTSGSIGNVAGLLNYCMQNNYLSGDAVTGVKDKLMGKLPGGSPTADPGYNEGSQGVLHSSDGKKLDLSGQGLKAEAAKKICDTVLAQGKSLL